MRKVPLTVSIPQPCLQPWEDMTPEAHGRFCGNCQKSVIDFSDLSDSEILTLLSDTSKKYCGRFKKSQLERLVLPEQQAASLLPAVVVGVMLAASIPAAAANNHPQQEVRDTIVSRIITGKVTEKDGIAVAGAMVHIKGTNKGALADEKGYYQLSVPSVSPESTMLVFTFIGFEKTEVPLTTQQTVDVVLKPDDTMLAGEVVVCVKKATPWQRLKYKWRRLWHR